MQKPPEIGTSGKAKTDQTTLPNEGEEGPAPAALTVVGIGASAGGLDAFKRFLQAVPAHTGMAFVLVPHLDPSRESLMVELLARQTPMPVLEAEDGMAVEPDRVYVIPPSRYLAVAHGILRLSVPPRSPVRQPAIDFFLRSLADAYQERAIGIVLSGTGSHGTLGLQAIKGQDGLTMAQEPSSAEYPQMPQSVIAAGLADYVLAPEAMPEALVQYVAHASRGGNWRQPSPAGTELSRVLSLLFARTKYDFRSYRKNMLLRRIQRRMSVCHMDRLGDYMERLRSDAEEPGRLFRDLLIGVTGFFREPEAYEVLEQRVIGPLVEQSDPDAPVRVWVPGCSTGEEAYSIGILLIEGLVRCQRPGTVQIFATDIDEEALDVGRQGVYPESIAGDMSAERLQRFFIQTHDHYQVSKQLREMVVFAPQNLISDAPFSKLDLISCRNLMIYLEPEVQHKVIALFHFALSTGGHLLLGASESVGQQADLFETVSKRWRLFRRIGPTRRDIVEFPITAGNERSGRSGVVPGQLLAHRKSLAELTQRLLLEEYAPAAVLTNSRYEILYFFGPTLSFLDLPTGEPTRDLIAMSREGLRTKLRAACHKSVREHVAVTINDANVKRNGGFVPVEVHVKPLRESDSTAGLLLVTFADRPQVAGAEAGATRSGVTIDESSLVQQLDLELKVTRQDLQSTIEELESSNEELKASNEEIMSMNEELQSANEELETSKEELQSLNEELSTVNSQLRDKVDELEQSHNDITNLLSNADISTVFLDPSMRIKRFTPPTARLFNLRATDLGRVLSDFSPKFRDDTLLTDARAVLERLAPLEKEIQTNGGCHLLRRIQPYRTQDNRIEGVVITFVDITARIRGEQRLRESEAQLKALNQELEQRILERTAELSQREAALRTLVTNVPSMYAYVDAGEVYRYVNRQYEDWHNKPADQIVGQSVRELLGPENYAVAKPHIDKVLAGESDRYEGTFQFPDRVHTVDVVCVPDKDAAAQTKGFFVLLHDISERKALEREIIDASTMEQERIGRDIHDGIGQQLTALAMLAGSVQHKLATAGRSDEAEEVQGLVGHLQDALAQARALARGLSPVEIDPDGLSDALSELADGVHNTSEVDCRFVGTDSVKVADNTLAVHLYRIAQEAVHNALRHGQPQEIEIRLSNDGQGLALSVQDDGTGMEPADERPGRLGLQIMRYRASIIGGTLTVGYVPGGGTRVCCRIPAGR